MRVRLNLFAWQRTRRHRALVVVILAAVAGAVLGHLRARNLITAEHLNPADPYIPVIYEKFTAAWAVGFVFLGMLIAYAIEFLNARRP
jgi:hypothetical protein